MPTLSAPDLATFFNPASLAFVGATEDIRNSAAACIKQMLEFGYEGGSIPSIHATDAARSALLSDLALCPKRPTTSAS